MYGGVPINCDKTEFEAQAIWGAFETELSAQAEKINETHYLFLLLKGVSPFSISFTLTHLTAWKHRWV